MKTENSNDTMLTKPVEDILPSSIDNKEIEGLLIQFSDAIREAVNYSTHVLSQCSQLPGDDSFLPVFLSFRHIIELLDAISLLVKVGSVDPCKILLRATLESAFNVHYILQKDTKQRSICFLVWYYNKRLHSFEMLDQNSPSGKQLYAAIKRDKLVGKMKIPKINTLNDAQDNIRKLLQKPLYCEVNKEYDKNRGKIKNWYSLYGGPKNLEQLADNLEYSGLYNVLFRDWSNAVHGTDIIEGRISSSEDGHLLITQIRNIRDVQTVTSISLSIALNILKNVISKISPDRLQDFTNWYKMRIRDIYLKINEGNKLFTIT